MSEFPLGEPRPPLVSRREQTAQEIESQAGKALSRDFWFHGVETPFGELSRRSLAITLLGFLLIIMTILALFWLIITTPPALDRLPNTDALTVTTHIFANFSGNKDPQPELYFAPEGLNLRFADAYTFFWQDSQDQRQQVILLQYDQIQYLQEDYSFLTRSRDSSQRSQVTHLSEDMVIEQRDLRAYGAEWRGFWLGNMLMLMSADVPRRDQQELYSHFITIMAANQRDVIPTPTPF